MIPPRLLKRKDAALYCGLSIAAFERAIASGGLPMPVTLENQERWCRKALDRALDILTGEADKPDYLQEFEERYGPKAA
jgi:predicted DNA-binding transcriptional regulator AlpA